MFNKVILVGNLTRDIELRYSSSGVAIAKVGIATNRRFKSATGELKDETMFIDLTFFGRTAEVANQYLRRGSKVLVEGRLILEQWVATDGTKRSRHSITVENMQMLDSRSDSSVQQGMGHTESVANKTTKSSYESNNIAPQDSSATKPSKEEPIEPKIPEIDIDENEIPF